MRRLTADLEIDVPHSDSVIALTLRVPTSPSRQLEPHLERAFSIRMASPNSESVLPANYPQLALISRAILSY
jgi:hypothetical protein